MRRHLFSPRLALAAAGLLFTASLASAQELRLPGSEYLTPQTDISAAAALTKPAVTLADAVRLTVQNNPEVRRGRQALASAVARAQQARGTFDSILKAKPGYKYLYNEIPPFLKSGEDDKRRQLYITYLSFDEVNRAVLRQLQTLDPRAPACPIGFIVPGFENDPFLLDRLDPQETGIRAIERDLQSPSGLALEASLGIVRLRDICNPSPLLPSIYPEAFADFWRSVNAISSLNLNNVIDTFTQFPRENLLHVADITEAVSTRALLALERLGDLPDDEIRKNQYLELSWNKLFRSGLSLGANGRYEAEERNFHEKSLDPSFGGLGINPRFPSSISLTTNIPLLKRRGAVSTAASERAARLAIDAQRAQLRHVLASEVFRTVFAYLSLQANQLTLQNLEESLARQGQIVELTQARFKAGDVVRIDVDRAQARRARVQSSVANAKANLAAAQIALARAIGVDLDVAGTLPTAADPLSPSAAKAAAAVQASIDAAIAARQDLRSLNQLRLASQALADGASSDLKNTLDFSLTAGLNTLYESPLYKYLPDELEPLSLEPRIGFNTEDIKSTSPRDTPVRYYSGTGFMRSVQSEWQPFVQTSISLRWPFGNNAAKGRFGQASASLSQSQIQIRDADRKVRAAVVTTRGVVERAARGLARAEEAQGYLRQVHQGTLERFRSGDVTLLDTLITEEDLTQVQIQLAQAWLGYAGALARLRFEQGVLVSFDSLEQAGESLRFDPASFLTR